MISGLMGYLAIATFALARSMVANQGSQITGAFSGAISGLGLSAFAVRSAAQGKIETPLGSVGPEGVKNWNELTKTRDIANPEGYYQQYSTQGSQHIQTTTINGRMAYESTGTTGSKVTFQDGVAVSANANNGLSGKVARGMGDRLEAAKREAAANEKSARIDAVNAIAKTGTDLENFLDTLGNSKGSNQNKRIGTQDSVANEEGVGQTDSKDKSYNFENSLVGSIKAWLKLSASQGLELFGTGAKAEEGVMAEGSASAKVSENDVDKSSLNTSEQMKQLKSISKQIDKAIANGEIKDVAYARNIQAQITQTTQTLANYSTAHKVSEEASKAKSAYESNSGEVSKKMDLMLFEDLVKETGSPFKAAQAFHDLSAVPEKYEDKLNQIMEKKYGGAVGAMLQNFENVRNKENASISNIQGLATGPNDIYGLKKEEIAEHKENLKPVEPDVDESEFNKKRDEYDGVRKEAENRVPGKKDSMFLQNDDVPEPNPNVAVVQRYKKDPNKHSIDMSNKLRSNHRS